MFLAPPWLSPLTPVTPCALAVLAVQGEGTSLSGLSNLGHDASWADGWPLGVKASDFPRVANIAKIVGAGGMAAAALSAISHHLTVQLFVV